jgi:hypothetical protein
VVGSDLTKPLIASVGGQDVRVGLLNTSQMVASKCQIVACDASTVDTILHFLFCFTDWLQVHHIAPVALLKGWKQADAIGLRTGPAAQRDELVPVHCAAPPLLPDRN